MIVFTTCICFLIAVNGPIPWWAMVHTAIGVFFAGGGSLVLNQHMERELDAQMERTAGRPIPSGRISARTALILGWVMMMGGYIYLWILVNPACSIATIVCGVSYLYMYTPMKRRTSFSSFVGAIPGGMLPIMGWVAVRNSLDFEAWVLFAILFIWQIPHALIISIRYREDYASAGMKQLPIITPSLTSRRQIALNVLVLMPVSLVPFYLNMTDDVYPLVALAIGFVLFVQVARYILKGTDETARSAFITLTAYLPVILLALYLDKPA